MSSLQTDLSCAILPGWMPPPDHTTTIYSYGSHGNVATQIDFVTSAPEAVVSVSEKES